MSAGDTRDRIPSVQLESWLGPSGPCVSSRSFEPTFGHGDEAPRLDSPVNRSHGARAQLGTIGVNESWSGLPRLTGFQSAQGDSRVDALRDAKTLRLAKPMTRTTPEPNRLTPKLKQTVVTDPAGGVADGENATVKVDRTAQAGES